MSLVLFQAFRSTTFSMRPAVVPINNVLASIARIADGNLRRSDRARRWSTAAPRFGSPAATRRRSPLSLPNLDRRIEQGCRRWAWSRASPSVALVGRTLERHVVIRVIYDVRIELVDAAIATVAVGDVIPDRASRCSGSCRCPGSRPSATSTCSDRCRDIRSR